MKMHWAWARGLAVLGLILGATLRAEADQLILNGGFESGFTNWSTQDEAFSDGAWYHQSGTQSPLNLYSVAAPPEGTYAAMSDQSGLSSNVLYQDFVIPTHVVTATLSFQLYLHNYAGSYAAGADLDAFGANNQQFRADVLTASSDPFSVASGDLLQKVYQTAYGDPNQSGYSLVSEDVTALFQAHLGETLRLRFATVNNMNYLVAGVDAVSVNVSTLAPVPEPSTFVLAGLGSFGAIAFGWRRRQRSLA